MPPSQHRLERRATKLGQALGKRIETVTKSLGGPQGRPPFTEQLSERDALAFWRRHRYDSTGAQVLQRMKPADVLELDAALQRMVDQEQQAGLPVVSEPMEGMIQ